MLIEDRGYAMILGCRKQVSLNGFVANISPSFATWMSVDGDVGPPPKQFRWGGVELWRLPKLREFPIEPYAMGFEKSTRKTLFPRIDNDGPAAAARRGKTSNRNCWRRWKGWWNPSLAAIRCRRCGGVARACGFWPASCNAKDFRSAIRRWANC